MDSASPVPPPPEPPVARTGLIDNALNIVQEFGQRAPFLSVAVSLLTGVGIYTLATSLRATSLRNDARRNIAA